MTNSSSTTPRGLELTEPERGWLLLAIRNQRKRDEKAVTRLREKFGEIDPSRTGVLHRLDLGETIHKRLKSLKMDYPCNSPHGTTRPTLHNYCDGYPVRFATAEELAQSIEAAKHDGGRGVIAVEIDGEKLACYVVE